MLHMNNARYLRECDFARIALCFSHGIIKATRACRATIIAGGLAIRYRRSLTLFERFIIRTKILCWDSKAFYMEQQFVARRDGRTAAVALVKMNVRGATPDDVVRNLCRRSVESPTPPLEVQCWMEYDDASRQALSDEGQ
uniref:protein THEM6-like n=1 Tax=Myxine glutinosa TaxID=7769 RepID=UPI00358FBBB6